MQLSTVRRESLIPPVYLLSIALLLTVAFIVLLPSRESFTFTIAEDASDDSPLIDDLDLAYLKARESAGDLATDEMRSVISTMIRGKKWQQARDLMHERPDIVVDPNDLFLLRLETATAGYFEGGAAVRDDAYEAGLISMMSTLLDTPALYDTGTLTRASQISADLKQPELAAAFYLLLSTEDSENAVKWLEHCASVLSQHNMHSESADCYRTAITRSDDPQKQFELTFNLANILVASGDRFAANAELEKLVVMVPQKISSLEKLADLTLGSERPDLAYPLYARLSQIDEPRAVFWLEKAAKWAEGSNLPGLAAEYVFTIASLSEEEYQQPLAKRRQKLLMAAGRNEEALQTVHERIADDPNSAEILLEGINLANSMGLPAQSMQWNERLLAIRPYDIDAMQRQIDFSMANNLLDRALHWAGELVAIEPQDKTFRLRLAQLEEWNGNIQNAQDQRQWLADKAPGADNDRQLIRLAELNWDAATAARTLRRMAKREPLSSENVIKLVKLYEQDGRPDEAAQALQEMLGNSKLKAMLLRETAALHKRHYQFEKSLHAWEAFAARFGRSGEESLNRMELHWRLKQPSQAVEVTKGIENRFLGSASMYQLKLLTEIGWRYDDPDLVLAATSLLEQLDLTPDEKIVLGRRKIQSLLDNGDADLAVRQAEDIWRSSGDLEFLLAAMHIALNDNVYPHLERYLDASDELIGLRQIPEYWLTIADYHNRNSDTVAALETYENTLMMEPDNTDAMSGLIWTLLASEDNNAKLLTTLEKYQTAAVELPNLWSPYAVGYLRVNKPHESLRWFSKLMVKDDHDYNILLSFADALEQTGNTPHAYKVRSYALGQLRPLVLAGSGGETNDLARDYVGLLQTYGSASENELWTERLLEDIPAGSEQETSWRRELAASWYLATQRSDYARLIMTKTHEKRLQSPVWQQLAVALHDDNIGAVREILASGQDLSTGDQILALRKIGKERQAYVLARNTMENGLNDAERNNAREHVMALRGARPGYYSAGVRRQEIGNLNITESGLSLRHTLAAADIGFAVDVKHNELDSGELALAEGSEDDVAVTAWFGNTRHGGRITTGINSQGQDDLNYTSGRYFITDRRGRRELSTEVAINEVGTGVAELRVGAKQDRAEVAFETAVGRSEFIKLSGQVNEISTRDDDQKVSRGAGASIELGTGGSFGSNSWTMGVVASGVVNEREDELPESLRQLSQLSTFDNILSEDSQELAVSASLFRGGINANYPQAASPRYHFTARVGRNWPSQSTAFQVQAGAGFRVMGNDELSLELIHDRSGGLIVDGTTRSTVGIQYRNHF